MVLKLTFSVDYEDAHPHVLGLCPRASPTPAQKNPPPFSPKFSHNIYICIWVLRFISRIPILQKL